MTLTDEERETLGQAIYGHRGQPLTGGPIVAAVEAIIAARLAPALALHVCRDEHAARPICDVCWDDAYMGHMDWHCPTAAALGVSAPTGDPT